jgi:hypothetical protein
MGFQCGMYRQRQMELARLALNSTGLLMASAGGMRDNARAHSGHEQPAIIIGAGTKMGEIFKG